MRTAKLLYVKMLMFYVMFFTSYFCDFVKCAKISTNTSIVYKKYLKSRTLAFEDCGSVYDILYLNISSCNSIPCVMQRNSNVMVNVIFDDEGQNTVLLKHEVFWIFNAIKTYASISPDPCDGDHACIFSDNDGKSYLAKLHVSKTLPVISGSMKWQAYDDKNQEVICFKVPVVITV